MGARATDSHREAGFSLIELMMVVLVVGMLIAIALPTFLGARTQSQDRAAQSNVRSALVGALTYYAETRTYTGFDATDGETEIPSLAWVAPGPPASGQVAIHVASGPDLLLVALSSSGTYWCVAQVPGSPATSRGGGAAFASVDSTAECTGGW